MKLEELSFSAFRNLEAQTLQFSDGINILSGDNAQGKTNAIEAIYLFAAGKSFRGAKEREMIRFGAQRARVDLIFSEKKRDITALSVELFENAPKKCRENGVIVPRMKDFLGQFRAVLFCPEHLWLIKGASSERRAFLDGAISQLRTSYALSLAEYQKLLRQRNALLKEENRSAREKAILLEIFVQQMAPHNERIQKCRMQYLEAVQKEIAQTMKSISGGQETVCLCYGQGEEKLRAEEISQTFYYENAMRSIEREIAAGVTLHGCHRDDFFVYVNEKEAKKYCSQGQDRSLVLGLKVAEGALSARQSGEEPVYLFDDVLSELDAKRRAYLKDHLEQKQVILTCCDEKDASSMQSGDMLCRYEASGGKFTRK